MISTIFRDKFIGSAEDICRIPRWTPVDYTGHSKGGGEVFEALSNSPGSEAFVFNAAGPSPRIDAETRLNIARDILPTCDAAQLKDMFGPVNRYVVEREGIGMGATFSAPGGELIQELFAA